MTAQFNVARGKRQRNVAVKNMFIFTGPLTFTGLSWSHILKTAGLK